MKSTVDETTITQLVSKLATMFGLEISIITLPEFKTIEGIWLHNHHHHITVVKDDHEMEMPGLKPDWPHLLGIYKIETKRNEGKLIIFPDAIKVESRRYASHKSKSVENGKIVADLNNTMGEALTAKPTGLFDSDAFNYIEILCKIELILLNIIHNRFGSWKCEFYSNNNIDYVDILVMQITKDVIKEYDELVECFKYLNINMLNDSKFVFDSPEPFIKNITGISEQEWSLINNLDIFINCFPIEEKKVNETWKEFLIKTKENAEVSLMKLVNDRKADVCGAGWELISDYLTESANQSKCKNKLQNMKFGIGPKPYKLKWWKTWN